MKFLKLIAVVCLLSSTAFAGEDYLLRFVYYPGFEFHPVKKTTTVNHDGSVTYETEEYASGTMTHAVLGQLVPDRVSALEKAVEQLNQKDLVDLDEGEPFCTDVPMLDYYAKKHSGEEVTVSRQASCHRYEMPYSETAYLVKSLLASLTDLAQLQ